MNQLIKHETTTQKITVENTTIAESLITNTLRAQFIQEVAQMGLSDRAIELKGNSQCAVSQFKVSLRPTKVTPAQILSEGEFRCIALAAFLAELAITQSRAAIVFDDPVSSLDHVHREAIADRLATEARTRQLIVFTHDISFLFLLTESCRNNGVEVQCRHVTKSPDSTEKGLCHNDVPPKVQNITQRIQSLTKRLNNEKFHYEKGNETDWERTVRSLYHDIRLAWELAVEDSVGKVVTRFSNKVETKNLILLTVLTKEDCRIMRKAYGNCSDWLHSNGTRLNPSLSSPGDIQKEIDLLETWHKEISQKQNKIKSVFNRNVPSLTDCR